MKYRSEILWGEGYRDAPSVMAHETFSLENTDIVSTLAETILKNSPIRIDTPTVKTVGFLLQPPQLTTI